VKVPESPAMSMSERATHIAKLKKERNKLEPLKKRERDVTKSTEPRMAEMNCTDDEIKRSIVPEINNFPRTARSFRRV
jgi:hypothetical protein